MIKSQNTMLLYHSTEATQITQTEKDKIAFENTKKAMKQRKQMKKQYSRWTPQSINNQNSLFSQIPPTHKPLRKQNPIKKVQINIFNINSDHKSCVKKTDLSTRNSNLFSQQQTQACWKSSSKQIQAPISKHFTPQKTFKTSEIHNAKKTSINLAWVAEQQKSTDMSKSINRKGSYLYSSSIKF